MEIAKKRIPFISNLFRHSDQRKADEIQFNENRNFLNEVKDILAQIECIQCKFSYATTDEIIDALIYEEKALQSRYSQLLQYARQNNISMIGLNAN